MSTSRLLNLNTDKETVNDYQFEPIQGYPMLNWKGKRPFRSTHYYPAQLKEVHGPEVNSWRNKIYWGDNIQVMSHLLKEYRGKIKLIYIDPPFESKADYKKTIALRGRTAEASASVFEEKQYTDIWNNDEYLQFIYERLILMRELLSDSGSVYLHFDWHKSHYIKVIADEVFGGSNFLSEITWLRSSSTGSSKALSNKFPSNHDTLFLYSKSDSYYYKRQFKPYTEEYLKRFKYDDGDGKGLYRISDLNTYSETTLQRLKEENALIYPKKTGGNYGYKRYLTETHGIVIDDVWTDINFVNPMAAENVDYPTQKPEALLSRIIEASSQPGDIVFDCFMGSGTTQVAAMKMGRKFIGADINLGAIQTTTERLVKTATSLITKQQTLEQEETKYTGFEVYNVNHYDVFRNPVQAKELLIEALEIQPLAASTAGVYDGEKDGRMVKIMPINRIATRADLNELIAGFDYKAFERRQAESSNKPVEKLLLVCMGHEPDLAAHLKKELQPFNIDVEVVDILRDESQLEFRRPSEALLTVKKETLAIERFYPLNLLQKLSLVKEDVSDWRELVESVMIDWNYDGAILTPTVIDLPERTGLVSGFYPIPEGTGTIRVKITDLLSESWEGEIQHG